MDSDQPYPDRPAHWIRPNHAERIPHRWIVADTEAVSSMRGGDEVQALRCVDAVRWRDDLDTGDHEEWHSGESAEGFWGWVAAYCKRGARTVLWFHNASYDLRTLDCFRLLPELGFELEWCNLDRDVSVVTWRSDHGTLVICDTWTWLPKPLSEIGGMVGIGKPGLPDHDDSLSAWHTRCRADVSITAAAVRELLQFVRAEHLGNWQPSGAGMGYAAWRHRFLGHKILVHNDAPAIAAEREAMHAGRAEAWWHGPAAGGPFTEWDMHMSYCRIAAECDVPVKLFAHDPNPTPAVHKWAMRTWTVLARVEVTTDVPVVPARVGDRTLWPVGTFETTLWQPELELITRTGGTYKVLEQWRYNMAPALRQWATWSMDTLAVADSPVTPVQRAWVKHQSRALIGRLGLRNATWTEWGGNPFGWLGITGLVDGETGEQQRMMHVGGKTFVETGRREGRNSLPQITGYIMAVARVRLHDACSAAGVANVVHVDTDSLICNRHGSVALSAAIAAGLPGGWRAKEKWHKIDVTGPRHYRSSGRRCIPGVPVAATETDPGVFRGEVWESLATSLQRSEGDTVNILTRTWRPKRFDGRRPWTGEGPAVPIRLPANRTERNTDADDKPAGTADTRAGAVTSPAHIPGGAESSQQPGSGGEQIPRRSTGSQRRPGQRPGRRRADAQGGPGRHRGRPPAVATSGGTTAGTGDRVNVRSGTRDAATGEQLPGHAHPPPG